jgi:hypothetical protein
MVVLTLGRERGTGNRELQRTSMTMVMNPTIQSKLWELSEIIDAIGCFIYAGFKNVS